MLKPVFIIIDHNRLNCESFRDEIQFRSVSSGCSKKRRVTRPCETVNINNLIM